MAKKNSENWDKHFDVVDHTKGTKITPSTEATTSRTYKGSKIDMEQAKAVVKSGATHWKKGLRGRTGGGN